MSEQIIPEALHICPGCDEIASGPAYCKTCSSAAAYYDNYLSRTGNRRVGDEGNGWAEPIHRGYSGITLMLGYALFFCGWSVAMTVGIRYIWLHAK